MSSTLDYTRRSTPDLRDIAIASAVASCPKSDRNGAELIDPTTRDAMEAFALSGEPFADALERAMQDPSADDQRLIFLGGQLSLKIVELLAIALAVEVEFDSMVGRIIAHMQSPISGTRPSLGLVARAFDQSFHSASTLPSLVNGSARSSGLLQFESPETPLPEQTLKVPLALCMAIRGFDCPWPDAIRADSQTDDIALPPSVLSQARKHARALDSQPDLALVLRSGSRSEALAVAREIARRSGREPLFLANNAFTALGPWLLLRQHLPVVSVFSTPSERPSIAHIPGYSGPILALTGPDGAVDFANRDPTTWTLEVPSPEERQLIWSRATFGLEGLDTLARDYRHGPGRIAHLHRLARHRAAIEGREKATVEDILSASWGNEGETLEALAMPLRGKVGDEALVATPDLLRDLESLLLRCRLRDSLAAGLGASAQANYRSGVRALFTGPSGTGKTLAASWIATRMNRPLFRVDLASVTSKYIGETEKNLSKLLAEAEQADVVLLFDEADALFGKRTDVNDANDRYANAQTNYLLQRVENYDGIILMTSNSQSRFDSSFARRLDFIVEFPTPGPSERRRIWQSHLGEGGEISSSQLNELAALVDVSGGHIRNIVFSAAALAKGSGRPLTFDDILAGVASEYRKLGRHVPLRLKDTAIPNERGPR